MLPSNLLNSGPYGPMYSVSVQFNACTFYSLKKIDIRIGEPIFVVVLGLSGTLENPRSRWVSEL